MAEFICYSCKKLVVTGEKFTFTKSGAVHFDCFISEKRRNISDEIFKGLARMNLMGMTASEEYGGLGADAMTTGIVAEEIAKADPTMSIHVLFLVDNAWTNLINKYGTNELKSEILPDVAKGKSIVGIASTEPNFGSDIGSMTTVAKKNGSKYVLEGEKAFISLIRDIKERSGGFVTVAKTDPSKGTGGVSLFYLPYSDRLDISKGMHSDNQI